MGRAPCCDKANVKRGPWSPEEDAKLKDYINNFGTGGNWIALPLKAGLKRCGKSCRLRWLNYLRPNIKHGEFSSEEDRIICSLFASIGSRWSIIAGQLPGRTDNDIKNYWNTKLKKKLIGSTINNNMISSSTIPQNNMKKYHNYNHNNNHMISSILSPYDYTNYNNNSPSSTMTMSFTNNNYSTLLPMQVKDNSTLLMFGADQAPAPATSSEGSCSINNRSYNNNYGFPQVHQEEDEKPSTINTGLWGQISQEGNANNSLMLDNYGLEEIKELISSNNNNNEVEYLEENNKNNDANMMYYYY